MNNKKMEKLMDEAKEEDEEIDAEEEKKPDVIVVQPASAPDIHITIVQSVQAPTEKKEPSVEVEREPRPPAKSEMQSSGFSTSYKVKKFGSSLEKGAVKATQDFKRHGITVKDSRAS